MEGVSWWLLKFNFYFWAIKIVAIDLNTWIFWTCLDWIKKSKVIDFLIGKISAQKISDFMVRHELEYFFKIEPLYIFDAFDKVAVLIVVQHVLEFP